MNSAARSPLPLRWTARLEATEALDRPVDALRPVIGKAFATGRRGELLRGEWLGHPLHPSLTDVAIGSWASATALDLVGGRDAAGAAQRLIGIGLAAAAPTAWSGWADWSELGRAEQRIGVVHALANAAVIGTYAASWVARRRGRHGTGVALGVVAAGVMAGAAYLGGHLAERRHVGGGTGNSGGRHV